MTATGKKPAGRRAPSSGAQPGTVRVLARTAVDGYRYVRTREPGFIAGAVPVASWAAAAHETSAGSPLALTTLGVAGAGMARYYAASDHARRNRAMRRIGRALVAFDLKEPDGQAPRMKNLEFTPAGKRVDVRVPRQCAALAFERLIPALEDELGAMVRVQQIAAPRFGPLAAASRALAKAHAKTAATTSKPAPVRALIPRGGVRLTIVERDTLAAPLTDPWPVLKPGPDGKIPARRWYDPLPLARDEDGHTVDLSFAKRPAILIGGESGSGKSVMTHEIVGGWLLDPRARMLGWDGKGELEFSVYKGLADTIVGPDPVAGTELLKHVRYDELARREAYLRSIGEEQADLDDPECYPLLLALEELTAYSKHPEFWDHLLYILVRVRALNMRIVKTIQRPSSKSMPTDVRDNTGMKVAHSVTTSASSDMCLGDGWAANGWNAKNIPLDESGQFAGINLLLTDGSAGPRRTRTWPVLKPERALIVARARELRGMDPVAALPAGARRGALDLTKAAPVSPPREPIAVRAAPQIPSRPRLATPAVETAPPTPAPAPVDPDAARRAHNATQFAGRRRRTRPGATERRPRAIETPEN